MRSFDLLISLVPLALLATEVLGNPINDLSERLERKSRSEPAAALSALQRRSSYPYPTLEQCRAAGKDMAADTALFYCGLNYYSNGDGWDYLNQFGQKRKLLEVGQIYPDGFVGGDLAGNGGAAAYQTFADRFSGVFAEKAKGTAYLLTPSECNPDSNSVWSRVEYVNLTRNAAVTKIIRIDPKNTALSTTIYPAATGTGTGGKIRRAGSACPSDPPVPLPPHGSATSTSATKASASASGTAVAQAAPSCNLSNPASTTDAQNVQTTLAGKGNGASNNNCCAGGSVQCQQLGSSGTAIVSMCGTSTKQCAGCGNLAISLKDIIVDCTKNNQVGGSVSIPYLNGVSLQLTINSGT